MILRIAQVAPVATSIPPLRSGSIETTTALLTDGLISRGHDVTLFATGSSVTKARLYAIFPEGYHEDPGMWPWELCELFNLAAAVERAGSFDIIHYQAEYSPMALAFSRVSPTPILQTLHHSPTATEVALWSRYPEAPLVAVSDEQAQRLAGLNVVATVHHAVDTAAFVFQPSPADYLLFLGRFTEGKGVLQAIDVARRTGMRLLLAAAKNDYYHDVVSPLVDERQIVYVGEVDREALAPLIGGARALLYPVQEGEPFGLVLAEAAACGTPSAALGRGAVREIVDEGITGCVFDSLEALVDGLPRVLALDRAQVRARAVERFGVDRMVDAYVDVYSRLIGAREPGPEGAGESRGGQRFRAARQADLKVRTTSSGDLKVRTARQADLKVRTTPSRDLKVRTTSSGDLKVRTTSSGDLKVRTTSKVRATSLDDLGGRSLLAVFAHPDDESLACGGLLAWCAQLGVKVSLLCATHGECGPGADLALRETRARELHAAARVLGISDLILLNYPDGMLAWADAAALEADIRGAIQRLRPDVVITFGEDGLYWHPDHIAIHERTTAAVAALGPMDSIGDDTLPALYYVTMPPGGMRAVVNHAVDTVARQGAGGEPPRLILGIDEADAFGAQAAPPTLIVDASGFAAHKLAAIKCHQTQLGACALNLVTESDAPRLLGTEHFRRADVGSTADAFIERFTHRTQ